MAEAGAIGRLKQLFVPGRVGGGTALREAAALTVSRYVDQALMLLTPMLLVRVIDPAAFGEYRIFWLAGTTIALLAPLGIPNSLLYFFPRLDIAGRARFLGQALLFMGFTTALWIAALFLAAPLLPSGLVRLMHAHPLEICIFAACWTLSTLLDTLPIAAKQVYWQSGATVAVSAVRTALVLGTAILFRDVEKILLAVAAFTIFRVAVLAWFVKRRAAVRLFPIERQDFTRHLRYSLPFGCAGLLYSVRRQGEQWIAAAMFSASAFGAFTIGLSLLLPFDVVRNVISTLLLPRMSQAQFAGSVHDAVELNRRGNVLSFFAIMPGVAFLFAFAPDVIGVLFTHRYLAAAPVLRIYLIQVAILLEITTILNVLRLGRFQIGYAVFLLPLSIGLSYLGAHLIGMPGAAVGSLVAQLLAYVIVFWRLSQVLATPVSKLQDWRTLFAIAFCAVGAAAIALLAAYLAAPAAPVRCALGAAVLALAYLALVHACGISWILAELRGRRA
ncbi:MAG TPA: oligosaccharide flippase family protein [Rhizomicrobium sp.]|nr:oligosaccharide flippase family protein [Rhizomicrobium sp.]